MHKADPKTVIRLDAYAPPAWLVKTVHLTFNLSPSATRVVNRMVLAPGPGGSQDIHLPGRSLALLSLMINDIPVSPGILSLTDEGLTIPASLVPDGESIIVEIETRIDPQANTSLEGLYRSQSAYCTQCEAQGFRKITYYPDRPDILAEFRTRIIADGGHTPVMLSNGNPVGEGITDEGRKWVEWHDPFPKPSYLFALVAGDLAVVKSHFTTLSGRDAELRIYVEHGNEDRCDYAMDALKRAMRWDEETYGREYDLDLFMIVAVSDFNMGAMENKGLNIFNAKYILARPDTATDQDYALIEGIIAHEYFHNWSGNRVTCRDWFQLCLKEGLTVFRDQQFSADMRSAAVKRIEDVRLLRTRQFPEDSGPLSHPVRPDKYFEINNFYTATVYEKGAELVRMLHSLLGPKTFREAMDLYFERHDGEAAIVEDFLECMADASGRDLSQFQRWYSQSGTPVVEVKTTYDAASRSSEITFKQHTPPTPDQPDKQALHIPLKYSLLEPGGRPIGGEQMIELRSACETVVTDDVPCPPVLSVNRGFSAPVRVSGETSGAGDLVLMGHDTDPFNRWEAGQRYGARLIHRAYDDQRNGRETRGNDDFIAALKRTALDDNLDPAFRALTLHLPSLGQLAQDMDDLDPSALFAARNRVLQSIVDELAGSFRDLYEQYSDVPPYSPDAIPAARRSLRNTVLNLLSLHGSPDDQALAGRQYSSAANMTDRMAALAVLSNMEHRDRVKALDDFYDRWKTDDLVLDKWFTVQAISSRPDTLKNIKELTKHSDFTLQNPNRLRSLIGAFAHGNMIHFHTADGSGYRLVADIILELDKLNPQVAARMLGSFEIWKKMEPGRRKHAGKQLERIARSAGLSRDVTEIVTKLHASAH